MKVILFSKTGERATPFMRQAARDYWTDASFGFILWREEESSFWWNMYVDLFAYVHPPFNRKLLLFHLLLLSPSTLKKNL